MHIVSSLLYDCRCINYRSKKVRRSMEKVVQLIAAFCCSFWLSEG